ncbi:MAG: GAF domain-containing protein [Betaproteobacteria bacterium]|nr:GAF domain-containing protein [Betaproteobacteria bacterium]
MPDAYLDHLNRVVACAKEWHHAADLFSAVGTALREIVGYRLFTVLYVAPGAEEVARVHTSDPASYPLGGRKRMGPTPWGALVIRRRQPYIGRNDEDIRWAFPDHELIRSLNLSSVLNIAISHDGACVGTLNLLHEANWYGEHHIALAEPFGALLVPSLIHAARLDAQA